MQSLYIDKEVSLSVYYDNFLIKNKAGKKINIPANEVKTILIDNFFSISKDFLNLCNKNNITLIFTNEKHYPSIMLLNPNNPFFKMYETLNEQLKLDKDDKLKLRAWKKILFIKFINQQYLTDTFSLIPFRKVRKSDDKFILLQIEGDMANIYYKDIFGEDFKRKAKYFLDKDVVNSFLNYGYSILRSKIIHYLTLNGLLPYFSIFHSPQSNNFALADDLIECYRYAIDYLLVQNIENFRYADILEPEHKKLALSVFSLKVRVKNKGNFLLDNAIELAIKDYKYFLLTKDLSYLNTLKTKLY